MEIWKQFHSVVIWVTKNGNFIGHIVCRWPSYWQEIVQWQPTEPVSKLNFRISYAVVDEEKSIPTVRCEWLLLTIMNGIWFVTMRDIARVYWTIDEWHKKQNKTVNIPGKQKKLPILNAGGTMVVTVSNIADNIIKLYFYDIFCSFHVVPLPWHYIIRRLHVCCWYYACHFQMPHLWNTTQSGNERKATTLPKMIMRGWNHISASVIVHPDQLEALCVLILFC